MKHALPTKVETVSTASLKPNPRNARKHSDKKIEMLKASILKSKIFLR